MKQSGISDRKIVKNIKKHMEITDESRGKNSKRAIGKANREKLARKIIVVLLLAFGISRKEMKEKIGARIPHCVNITG